MASGASSGVCRRAKRAAWGCGASEASGGGGRRQASHSRRRRRFASKLNFGSSKKIGCLGENLPLKFHYIESRLYLYNEIVLGDFQM